jgi:hypothetical protein
MGEKAVAKDPNYGAAYSLLAQIYALEAANFQKDGPRNLARAEQLARKAVALTLNRSTRTWRSGSYMANKAGSWMLCRYFVKR